MAAALYHNGVQLQIALLHVFYRCPTCVGMQLAVVSTSWDKGIAWYEDFEMPVVSVEQLRGPHVCCCCNASAVQ